MDIVHFDILAQPGDDMAKRQPDPNGMSLWKQVHEQTLGRVALLVDGPVDRPLLEHWLKLHGVKAAVYEVLDDFLGYKDRAEKVSVLYSTGRGRTGWVYTSDAKLAEQTLRLGLPTMLVANPVVIRHEWFADTPMRGWTEVVNELERQQAIRAERAWEGDDVDGEFEL